MDIKDRGLQYVVDSHTTDTTLLGENSLATPESRILFEQGHAVGKVAMDVLFDNAKRLSPSGRVGFAELDAAISQAITPEGMAQVASAIRTNPATTATVT